MVPEIQIFKEGRSWGEPRGGPKGLYNDKLTLIRTRSAAGVPRTAFSRPRDVFAERASMAVRIISDMSGQCRHIFLRSKTFQNHEDDENF